MTRNRMLLYGVALAVLLPTAACSSNGRVAMNGGIGPGQQQAQNPDPQDPGQTPPEQPGQPAALVEAIDDGAARIVDTAGNLGAPGGDTLGQTVTENSAPLGSLARVSVGNETTLGGAGGGAQGSPIGVSVASEQQTQGSAVTLGVLSNGQVATVNTPALNNGQGDLIGLTADSQQIIGEGQSQTIGAGLLAPNNTTGDAASVNVLSGGQILNAQVNGVTTPSAPGTSVVDTVTETLGDLLDGGG